MDKMSADYKTNINSIAASNFLAPEISVTYFSVLEFVCAEQFRGACHVTAALLHVLLREKGIENTLVCGELGKGENYFDHSWVEIDGKIYDIAVALPLIEKFDGHPIFASCDISTLAQPTWTYGVSSGIADDPSMSAIKACSFVEYMDNAPYHKHGLWHFAQKLGRKLGLRLNLNAMRNKFSGTIWTEKKAPKF